jgi:hypothetical protein
VQEIVQRVLESDITKRAVKTGLQTAMSVITVDALFKGDIETVEKAAYAGAAAGFSVLWNAGRAWVDSIKVKKSR